MMEPLPAPPTFRRLLPIGFAALLAMYAVSAATMLATAPAPPTTHAPLRGAASSTVAPPPLVPFAAPLRGGAPRSPPPPLIAHRLPQPPTTTPPAPPLAPLALPIALAAIALALWVALQRRWSPHRPPSPADCVHCAAFGAEDEEEGLTSPPSLGRLPRALRPPIGAPLFASGPSRGTTALHALKSLKIFSAEKFSRHARRAVRRAEGEANRLGRPEVGTEAMLLGVIGEKDGLAGRILLDMGLTYELVTKQIERVVGSGPGPLVAMFQGKKPYSARMKNLLERADMEAFRTKCDLVGTEHLLLSLLREKDGKAVRVLKTMGVDIKFIERSILVKIQMAKAEAVEETRRLEEYKKPKNKKTKKGGVSDGTGDDQSHLSLKDFSTNVTDLAKAGQLDPLIGRYKEVERVTQILGRRRKNNAVLVGEPGVGKTAIAEGIALRIVNGEVPPTLRRKQIIELDMGMLVAGTKYRGEFEERLGNILREVEENPDIVLVIDEIHTLVGAGGTEGGADAANLLKPAMARGALQLIGATTLEEYRKYIEKDAALERRFQPVDVPEPTEDECVEILRGLKARYEAHHDCKYTDEAIKGAVHMSKRYVADRFLPDKAIDIIDEAGARMRLRHDSPVLSEKGLKLAQELKEVMLKKDSAAKAQDFLKAQQLFEQEAELAALIEQEKKRNRELSEAAQWAGLVSPIPIVTESDIAQVVAAVSGVPVDKVSASESSSLMNLEQEMREMMVGQTDAVQAISQAIRRARTGMRDPSRPIGSFIFAGPTGVGKSQLAKALCTSYFGSEDNMVRLDMSEYMEKHTVSKLIGSPPGYVGYDEGGGLTEKVRRSPYTLVLFDEVEKAHKDVFNLMLQILDDGRLTDAKGRTVDFKNTMVIMTTNIGSDVIMQMSKKAQQDRPKALEDDEALDEQQYQQMKSEVDNELKKFFRPEFLNRLDGIIVFHKLTKNDVRDIAEIFLKKTYKRMKEKKVELEITPAFKERLVDMGYNPTYGARPLRRAMSTMIEDQLAEVVLRGKLKDGDVVTMDILDRDVLIVFNQDGELLFRRDVSSGNFGIS